MGVARKVTRITISFGWLLTFCMYTEAWVFFKKKYLLAIALFQLLLSYSVFRKTNSHQSTRTCARWRQLRAAAGKPQPSASPLALLCTQHCRGEDVRLIKCTNKHSAKGKQFLLNCFFFQCNPQRWQGTPVLQKDEMWWGGFPQKI